MHYFLAKKYADRIYELLEPHCDKINIAGSVRRLNPSVKDIEVVCLPKKQFINSDLFGGGDWYVTDQFKEAVNYISQKHFRGGWDDSYFKCQVKGGPLLDLFMPKPADYYRILAIRTGSAQFSRHVIAYGWVKKGWCGSNKGLRRITDCRRDGDGWKCINLKGEQPPVWQNEEEFFEWIGVEYIEPKDRNTIAASHLIQELSRMPA